MSHKKKDDRHRKDYKGLLRDLRIQEKMNEKFIEGSPRFNGEIFKYLAQDPITGEFSVLGAGLVPSKKGFETIGDEPRLPKQEGVFMR